MLAKITSKNQLTLPKEIVTAFPDTDYYDVSIKDRKIILAPVKITTEVATLEGIRDKMERLGISSEEVAGAVAWARKKKSR